jgi:hypothetical protein
MGRSKIKQSAAGLDIEACASTSRFNRALLAKRRRFKRICFGDTAVVRLDNQRLFLRALQCLGP